MQKAQFDLLIAAANELCTNYGPEITVTENEHGPFYQFNWFDSGEGCVSVQLCEAGENDENGIAWDTDISSGSSDVWSPFDCALMGMWAVSKMQELRKVSHPNDSFTGGDTTILY